MTDYIKREDAIKWATDFIEGVEEECDICIVDPGGWESVHDYCEEAITCMIPSADVGEGVQRNEDFNRVIEELLEIEAKNDIGYFTSTERRLFNAYVEDLLSMTIERAEV